ncbi:MAG: IS630 family transposase [bacterium]
MSSSVLILYRAARRRLQRTIRKSRDAEQVRRASALLQLDLTGNATAAAASVAAARSSLYRWASWFEIDDVEGLRSLPYGRRTTTVTAELIDLLCDLVRRVPTELGYLRTRWSSELLAIEIRRQLGGTIHASTVRRLLPVLGFGYRRARPFLFRRDPRKAERMAAIDAALKIKDRRVGVFYVDEADVNLNPKIGFGWRAVGKREQELVPTPGQNKKRYLAGALHAHTGNVVWVESERKNSELFINLLRAMRRVYRGLRRIILILDNVNTHSSYKTKRFLKKNPKFELAFQPTYHPWVNRIERLWKALHDTVTRNHRYRDIDELMVAVRKFMKVVQPFPGAKHGLARFASSGSVV